MRTTAPLALALAAIPAVAFAQTAATPVPAPTTAPAPASAAGGMLGGLGSLLGGGVPNIASTGVGNAAGLLGYCVKNNLLSGASAGSVLGKLTGQSAVTTSPGYAAGQSGILQTGQSGQSALSLNNVKGQLKTQVCNLVLRRAKSFL